MAVHSRRAMDRKWQLWTAVESKLASSQRGHSRRITDSEATSSPGKFLSVSDNCCFPDWQLDAKYRTHQ
jgi:hypothetical protein